MTWNRSWFVALPIVALLASVAGAQEPEYFQEAETEETGFRVTVGMELKTHYRDSDAVQDRHFFAPLARSFPAGIPLSTVEPGSHFEVSVLSLLVTAQWADSVTAHAKLDAIDRYERNPTSGDRDLDVDELWLRVGRETPPAVIPTEPGYYLKIGKFPHFERQNDRHLESYGLISTAFNRLEDIGLEVGVDIGERFYVKGSLTQGNPLFMRDFNALAGDNGLGSLTLVGSGLLTPGLGSGFPSLYDAEPEGLDLNGNYEIGIGLGTRFGTPDGRRTGDFLLWHYQRDLADTAPIRGTFYGGDLDVLDGPVLDARGTVFSFAITDDKKEETGANLWLYWDALTVFGQYVDQKVAGFDRDGFEVELSYRLEFPLRWSLAGRQLFPSLEPVVRYSELDTGRIAEVENSLDQDGRPLTPHPAPTLKWDWEKLDYGLRLTIIEGIDVTVEYSDLTGIKVSGEEVELDEFLATLRWRL